ncbi:MAG: Stk1 family PASTA domain-containing Ser/Thr kinase, partial [Actinomycetota bacterium]|nr:Stk1 family PASTA domain-containing Ser/Thr kinase [Actinomycetota bacterium]
KLMHPQFARDKAFIERFRREAKAAASLNDPRIVSIFDWGADEGTYYIVMEYVDGKTVRDIIMTEGPLPPGRAVKIAADVCAGLHLAHQKGIVHRDIKPANIAVTTNGQTKVMDFGIARAASDAGQTVTQTGTVIGTANYFSPEQAQGFAVDARSDVYSLGVVLYEMLTGDVPFKGDTAVSIAYKHVTEDPIPPRRINPNIPEALEAIVMKALAKNPDNRYQSADEMRRDLVRLAKGERVEATPLLSAQDTAMMNLQESTAVLPLPARETEPPRRRRLAPIVVGALLVIAAALAAIFLFLNAGELAPTPTIVVPDVTNRPLETADRTLTARGLNPTVVRREFSDSVEANFVISQNPGAGQRAPRGARVELVISQGREQVAVPNVIGRTRSEAVQLLEQAGLQLGQVDQRADDTTPGGRVIEQVPRPQTRLSRGESVDLVISTGRPMATVPDLIGADQQTALARIQEAGLTSRVQEQCDSSQQQGVVISQDPAANSRVPEDSAVTIVVNRSAEVPSVVGESADEAQETLEEAGFAVRVERVFGNPLLAADEVVDQDPRGGARACPGATVRITVA